MKNFEYCDGRIGKRVTPSFWAADPEYKLITRIKMSCGGGMGGSVWYEYVERILDLPSNTIVKMKRYDGKEIFINTSWVVLAEDFTLVKTKLNISGWENAVRESVRVGIEEKYVIVDDGTNVILL